MDPVPVDPTSEGARRLIALSDAYLEALYPPESNHFESPEALAQSHVRFLGLYDGDALIACGGVKLMEDDGRYGELKRVYVQPTHRGHGHGRMIMTALEKVLIGEGYLLARLETGIAQPEALGLYRKMGYYERAPFGTYRLDPLSVFLEKRLEA